ncbi:subtilisin-like protease SBT1.8 [Eucalyptus grandis]|uniref:subtilisin-like protease SBT1.8 n=1 Tax=Eucalyptus grandis TaxID=71139 RepID=UPI00192ECFBC|nr:subtilisin-like protease SBT1.8 [Eucalyptus grandis]
MSSPRISSFTALLKAAHLKWSPSARRSAFMTTTYTPDNAGSLSSMLPVAHIPSHWRTVRDRSTSRKPSPLAWLRYLNKCVTFLCSSDYTIDQVRAVAKHPSVMCSPKVADRSQLNYPSLVLFGSKRVVRYRRELTNVRGAQSVYAVTVMGPSAVKVMVRPRS